MTALLFLAVLWHTTPPTTGSPVAFYRWQVRDPWGVVVVEGASYGVEWKEPDATKNIPGWRMVAGVDDQARPGPWAVSEFYTPLVWVAAWLEMGKTEHVAPLTHAVSWARALAVRDTGGVR